MTEREKLIEILINKENGLTFEELADYFLSNGVKIPVTCFDCKHRIYKDVGGDIGEIGGCKLFNVATQGDFYCSYGERKYDGKLL